MKDKVISGKNLPMRLPIGWSILLWLLLDRLHAVGWIWGIVGTLMAIVWGIAIYGICTQELVELKELRSGPPSVHEVYGPLVKNPGDRQ